MDIAAKVDAQRRHQPGLPASCNGLGGRVKHGGSRNIGENCSRNEEGNEKHLPRPWCLLGPKPFDQHFNCLNQPLR